MPRWQVVLCVVGMLITGTMNTLCTKIQFTMSSISIDGRRETFQKPWFGTFNMLLAMLLVLVFQSLVRCIGSLRPGKNLKYALIQEDASPSSDAKPQKQELSYERKVCMVAFPAGFDLLATAFACIGILYIPASVWQMLRGASIIFTAFFSVWLLKREMRKYHVVGLFCCTLGVVIVGIANVLGGVASSSNDGDSDSGSATPMLVFGMSMVVVGQVVQAAQVIAEEYLMKDVDLPAMEIVGFEGFWGLLMMIFLVYPTLYFLPGSDHGHLEDPFDTFALVKNSGDLQAMVLLYLFSCGTFNATGISVTQALSSVHRMMLDASRTTVIWAFGLLVHQVNPSSQFGEAWTPYSWLQLGGFVVLVFGQSVYGEVIKLPGFKYAEKASSPEWSSPSAALNFGTPPLPASTTTKQDNYMSIDEI